MKRMGEAMDGTVDYLARWLGNAYDSFLKTAPTNSYAVIVRRHRRPLRAALSV